MKMFIAHACGSRHVVALGLDQISEQDLQGNSLKKKWFLWLRVGMQRSMVAKYTTLFSLNWKYNYQRPIVWAVKNKEDKIMTLNNWHEKMQEN